jgi:hypothetical protein
MGTAIVPGIYDPALADESVGVTMKTPSRWVRWPRKTVCLSAPVRAPRFCCPSGGNAASRPGSGDDSLRWRRALP